MHTSTTSLGLVAALAAPAAAFFRMPCPGRILTERADPIVTPGGVSGHVHTISGGNGFGFDMDYAQARSSSCSSCPIKQDLSNYWTPKMYYQFQNGSFQDVPQSGDGNGVYGGMTVYYLQRPGPDGDTLKAFPEGFRMLAGDPFKRNATDDYASQAVNFVCLDYSGSSTQSAGLPNKKCPDGLRAQVFFPSCWDGVNLDSADHKSHMAYPTGPSLDNGRCPDTHPVHLISLFYEVLYSTSGFDDMWYGSEQPFVFAQGDSTGFGFHGDFVNGWDIDVLQEAVDTCTDDSGLITDCPVFEFFTDEESKSCIVPPSIDEQVTGVLDKLPGCNPVTSGPDEATSATDCAQPAIGTYKEYFTDVTGSLGYAFVGCASDSGGSRTLNDASESLDTMDVETCVDYCSGKGYTYAGLEYSSQCYCGNSIAEDRAPIAGVLGNCFSACSGNSSEFCGGASALSVYKKCDGSSCNNLLYTGPGSSSASLPSTVAKASSAISSIVSAATATNLSSSTALSAYISTETSYSDATTFSTTSSTEALSTSTETSSATATATEAYYQRKQRTWSSRQAARIAKARTDHLVSERQQAEVKATLAEEQNHTNTQT